MRAVWSGAISFGLIHIPVRLYNASNEKRLEFHYLRKQDLCPIRYARVCKRTGEEVPFADVAKGYEYQKGDFILLEDEDFKRASAEKYQTIDVFAFTDAKDIDPKYFSKPYFLEPTKEARKAYALLREALKKSQKVGVAKYMLRSREHLAVIYPQEEVLVLEQMRFSDEINHWSELKLPESKEANKRELDIAIKLIQQLTEQFKPSEFTDDYEQKLEKVIEAKLEGKFPDKLPREIKYNEIPDLMSQLKKSLEQAKSKHNKEKVANS